MLKLEKYEEIDYDALPRIGDLVRIFKLDEMIKKYKNKYINYQIMPSIIFDTSDLINDMYPSCKCCNAEIYFNRSGVRWDNYCNAHMHDVLAVVQSINEIGLVELSIDDVEKQTYREKETISKINGFTYCGEMVEVIERDYIQKIQEKRNKEFEELKAKTLEDDVMKEMLSKVDTKLMKRILSASMKIDATKIVGIDNMLIEWANAKKDLYKLLGNNLKITVERELYMDDNEKSIQYNKIRGSFPRRVFFV